MPGIVSLMKQFFCPAKPTLVEEQVPDLHGKVIIVTGCNVGLGYELARILYSKNAKVYMMARSKEKAYQAIESIKADSPVSKGELHYIPLDLSDLEAVKISAQDFLSRESRLHLLFNNAGVGYPKNGSVTRHGHELQRGVNCLGPFLLTKLLTPSLVSAAQGAPCGTVRVIWVSSSAAEAFSPKNFMDSLGRTESVSSLDLYSISKLGNYFHATEFASRNKAQNIISIPLNPGAMDSDFWRSQGNITTLLLRKTVLHKPVYGAYTNLFAAFSPEVTLEKSGHFIAPWGQFWDVSQEMRDAARSKSENGTGVARQFWQWCEEQVESFA
ncbi:hypothetical protein HIM_06816 [Hirsutella minnesotensis 3608]|uniref:Short-chain dehydrogenase n=1 Tax=Hirsutella minnesotensis 3608 TaxID=1043627 RepID=A0A0F7ZTU0_9HYPO|nr:hypothetical protein HIM_06816 [Hirsutella minnesotensis 3608]